MSERPKNITPPEGKFIDRQPIGAELLAKIQEQVSPKVFEGLSVRPPEPPEEITLETVPKNVDPKFWTEYVDSFKLGKPGFKDYHEDWPHPPQLTVSACHGGREEGMHNHAFRIVLLTYEWEPDPEKTDIGFFPKWKKTSTNVTNYYPDGSWMDEPLIIGEREFTFRRKLYSHGPCSIHKKK